MHEFRRMMQRLLKNNWQSQWVFGALVLLCMGLLTSRALLSIASVLIVVPFFLNAKLKSVKTLLLAVSCILFPVLISFFWSTDKNNWWETFSVRLPLLTMMLGLVTGHISKWRWMQIAGIYIILVTLGCCWSLYQYAANKAWMDAVYLQAKTLPVPTDDDHIRFSWMAVIAVLFCVKCIAHESRRIVVFLFFVLMGFLVVYLHILAAKTGLVCLYLIFFLYLLHVFFIRKKWKTGLAILILLFAMGFIFYQTMPTLRNRIQYVLFDFSNYSKGNTMPGYGDAARVLSLRAGWQITNEHPFTGVGFGDIRSSVAVWHDAYHPNSLDYEKFLPANEWLVYGAGSGWPGMICFTFGFVLLLYYTTSKNTWSVALTLVSIIPFLIDDTLEGQYGVILLAFIAFFGQQKLNTLSPEHE